MSASTERRATNRLCAIYAAVSALALLFPHRPSSWPLLLLAHGMAVAVLLGVGPFRSMVQAAGARFPRTIEFIADWYPLLVIPALYTELATLNLAVWNGRYFDATISAIEQAVFRSQPSRDLAVAWPWLAVSEPLHAAYLSYYFIIYGPPIALYALGKRSAQRVVTFVLMLTFFAHYMFFIYFPVSGPRYLFSAPTGEIEQGFFYQLVHSVLEAGSSRGAAFPSSHVGVAAAATLVSLKLMPWVTPFLAIPTIGLALGAVYGGFHYATDAVAGLLFGVLLSVCAPGIRRWLSGDAAP